MILRSIEAERTKLIDDVNRDVTMLKFSVKESLDKLQQKFIAKMLRKHVEQVEHAENRQAATHVMSKPTLVQSPEQSKPSLGVIEEEQDEKQKQKRAKVPPKINA